MNSFKIFSFIVILLFAVSCSEKKDFNSIEWKNWVESEATLHTRWLMHKDLLKKYELKGISKDSILNLLGEPNKQYSDEFYYNLGYSNRSVDSATMIITFENDTVIDIKVSDG
ncbi:hypothetical protein SAMN02927921_04255 [Sinomicrobium oceani]|uniref:SmpA / OmlA family protein n=1 Tax=Sinomicrobium oceani TaxID=1150368 RepID=A0A1K1S0R0_9FLAO|nr:hypothetical protein [Sinomicrobium oceani]SFW77671.1 hypothetical protein SAMN02927921_04255 [Sinomicrobium oceani]